MLDRLKGHDHVERLMGELHRISADVMDIAVVIGPRRVVDDILVQIHAQDLLAFLRENLAPES